jgi:hypothetical protein
MEIELRPATLRSSSSGCAALFAVKLCFTEDATNSFAAAPPLPQGDSGGRAAPLELRRNGKAQLFRK